MKRNLFLSLLTALLMALAFPPFRTGFIGWFVLVPFFQLLDGKRLREGLRWSYLTGLFICITTLYWIGHVTQAGLIAAILIIPLYLTLYGLVHILLLKFAGRKAWLLLPFVWLVIEYLQSRSEMAFPWNYLGYTQSYYLPLIQYAEFTGVWGVSLWVMALNALIWLIYRDFRGRKRRYAMVAVGIMLLLPALQGSLCMHTSRQMGSPVTISLLQGNVDPFEKWEEGSTEKNIILYESMSRAAASMNPDLIIWPETAMPFFLRSETRYLTRIEKLIDSLRIPVLTGSLDYQYTDDTEYDYYNATFLIEPASDILQTYRKMRLVPGSERIPYRDFFPFNYLKNWLTDLALGVGDYSRGDAFTVLQINPSERSGESKPVLFSTPICYESVFPDLVRRFIVQGSNLLCIVTNDAWFGRTSAPAQHAQFAVFRAIENRVPIARCANTGISCFIDAWGRMTQRTDIFKKTAITGTVFIHRQNTMYTRRGDWLPHLCTVIALAGLLGVGMMRLWSRKKDEKRL